MEEVVAFSRGALTAHVGMCAGEDQGVITPGSTLIRAVSENSRRSSFAVSVSEADL